jgi:hypothetical protein
MVCFINLYMQNILFNSGETSRFQEETSPFPGWAAIRCYINVFLHYLQSNENRTSPFPGSQGKTFL